MRQSATPVQYLVGTPKGRLTRLEKDFLGKPWRAVRESVDVKLLNQSEELYVLARSYPRMMKERLMRQRRLKRLWQRLGQLQQAQPSRDQLLIKLGAAKKDAGRAWSLVEISLPEADQLVTEKTFRFALRKDKRRQVRQREGRYLLRSNLTHEDPAQLWQYYIQLTEVERDCVDRGLAQIPSW